MSHIVFSFCFLDGLTILKTSLRQCRDCCEGSDNKVIIFVRKSLRSKNEISTIFDVKCPKTAVYVGYFNPKGLKLKIFS